LLPGAHVVKAFNTIGAEHYLNPKVDGQTASMFICGDDSTAKSQIGQLVTDIGFDLVDAGPLANAVYVESMAKLWIYLMRSGYSRNIAFKLLKE
jgi:predicted dinucleotide-binding enzyme